MRTTIDYSSLGRIGIDSRNGGRKPPTQTTTEIQYQQQRSLRIFLVAPAQHDFRNPNGVVVVAEILQRLATVLVLRTFQNHPPNVTTVTTIVLLQVLQQLLGLPKQRHHHHS